MKNARRLVLIAVLLTLPIYLGIAHIPPLEAWFLSGRGWAVFEPIFRLCNAIGIHGNGLILIGCMLLISFGTALLAVTAAHVLIGQFRNKARSGNAS